jgi:hypothetical protein
MIAPLSINSSHADCRPERSFFRSLLLVANRERLGKGLLLLNRSPGSVYEGLDLLHGKAAIFVRVHRLHGSSAPVLAVSPTMPVTPAHHTAIVLDIIFDGAARSLDAP